MVIVKFWRYGVVHEEEVDTVEDALRFLAWGNDRGDLANEEIRDGDRVIRDAELDALVADAEQTL